MDLQNAAKPGSPNSILGVPEYILNKFFPGTLPLLARSPRFAKLISLVLALWWVGPSAFLRLKQFLDQFSSFFISSISVSSDEDLFEYLMRWLATQRTVRKEHSLVASLSNPSPNRKRNPYYPHGGDEISPQEDPRNVEIQYESSHGLQWLLFRRRLLFLRRGFGEGSVYNGGKSHRMETLTLSCIGRSTQPIKDLLEEVYREHKDKEKSLTIIRRPYGVHFGRNGWSRISQKPRYFDAIFSTIVSTFFSIISRSSCLRQFLKAFWKLEPWSTSFRYWSSLNTICFPTYTDDTFQTSHRHGNSQDHAESRSHLRH
jgi:mitochondrial chaperone BCS1